MYERFFFPLYIQEIRIVDSRFSEAINNSRITGTIKLVKFRSPILTSAVHVSSPNLETLLDNFTQAASLFISLEGGQRWRKVDAWKSFRRGTEKWSRAFFRTKIDSVFFYPAGIISFFFCPSLRADEAQSLLA